MLDLERTVICKIFKHNNQNYEIFVPISEEIGLRPRNSLLYYYLHLHIRRPITSHKNKNPKSIPKYFFNSTCLFFFGQIDPISLMTEEDALFNQKIKLSYLLPVVKNWYSLHYFPAIMIEMTDNYWII